LNIVLENLAQILPHGAQKKRSRKKDDTGQGVGVKKFIKRLQKMHNLYIYTVVNFLSIGLFARKLCEKLRSSLT